MLVIFVAHPVVICEPGSSSGKALGYRLTGLGSIMGF